MPPARPRSTPLPSPQPTARPKRGEVARDEAVFDAIFDAVMGGRLAPGTRLGEVALCERFGVSRTIVRQALQRLAQVQVVELTPNKGATVAAPTPEETREVFEARRAIEAAILPLAVARATRSRIERLRERVAAEHAALHAQDHQRWVRLAGDFHLALADLAGNRVLTRVLTELMSRCSLIVALYEEPGAATCGHDEHERLVDRIELGDTAGAIALMDVHLRALESRLRVAPPPPAGSEAGMAALGF